MPECAVCSTPAPPPFRVPPPEGAPDLDGRPGEPARSTLPRWLQRCRGCGACAPDLAAVPSGAAGIVRSEAYQAERSPFLRWAALAVGSEAEGDAWLQAAWSAEDAGQPSGELRRRAAAAWQEAVAPELVVRAADVLRRAGLFAEAAARLDGAAMPASSPAAAVAAFERGLIEAGDAGRHLLSSALRPPSRSPHVVHRQRAAAGLWGRLFRTGRS